MGAFGTHKLLSTFQGITLIRRSTLTSITSAARSVFVVTGYRHSDIQRSIADLPVSFVHNASFASGLAGSLAVGVSAAEADEPDGVMIFLADMPALTAPDLDLLISTFQADGGKSIIRAVGKGTPGNPVVFPKALFGKLKGLTGDTGARALIRALDLPVVDVEIGEGALIDVDTPDAIKAAGGIVVP